VPAIAAAIPCHFILLSSTEDAAVASKHPAWNELKRHCNVQIQSIDDLITDGHHSLIITLAFARAIRATGDAMLDICFIFMSSDYLFADGSLQAIIERIRSGISGVLAGNYQVTSEEALTHLRRPVDCSATPLVLRSRELVNWSLQYLHPTTIANTVNAGRHHSSRINRLFWQVDESTLIGRFYLLHMVAIRPELTDFIVGSSCDYSFVPELCPSGNVVTITDSDEYFVVEVQPRGHETRDLRPGPIEISAVVQSVLEWATADHRRNVHHTLIYHSGEIPDSTPKVVAEADQFVARVQAMLPNEPHPHRHHHYWLSSLAAYRWQVRGRVGRLDWEYMLGESPAYSRAAGLIWWSRNAIFGSPPDVTRFHPRWPDYGLACEQLRLLVTNRRLLLVASHPVKYVAWLKPVADQIVVQECYALLQKQNAISPPLGRDECCLIILTEEEATRDSGLVTCAASLLTSGCKVMILILSERRISTTTPLDVALLNRCTQLANSSDVEVRHVPNTRMRRAIYSALERSILRGGRSGWHSPLQVIFVALATIPLTLASYCYNLTTRTVSGRPISGLCSSISLIRRPPKPPG
jgi:hypothetical protein